MFSCRSRNLFAIEEERLNRIKTSAGLFPERAVSACLNHRGLSISDIDFIAIDGVTSTPLANKVRHHLEYMYGSSPQ